MTENILITLAGLAGLFVLQVSLPGLDAFVRAELLVSAWGVIGEYRIWSLLTYVFWHAGGWHLAANGMALFFFGGFVDARWSRRRFWGFCLVCAVGSGVAIVLWQCALAGVVAVWGTTVDASGGWGAILQLASRPTLGYSGVVTGLLGAFAYYMWDRQFHLFVIPMTGKWFLALIVVVDLVRFCGGANVSIAGHAGGLLVGFLVTHFWFADGDGPFASEGPEASDFEHELLESAEEALDREDWDEAYRLCHQLRSGRGRLPAEMIDDVWEMLAVATTRRGDWDEAETYLDRAPETERVEEARRRWEEARESAPR